MESIRILVDEAEYSRLVHGTKVEPALMQEGEITVAAMPGATANGRPGVVIAFRAVLPNGKSVPVQATTTLRALLSGVRALAIQTGLE